MNSLTDIVIKIIRGNSKKYKLFFICNIFAIAMFVSIIALSNNDSLNKLDSIIASNVYAPMYLMGLFIFFFVPYTQQLFQIQSLKDYGILRSIGMNHKEMLKCLVIQNGLMGIFSTLIGILLGEIFEYILIYLINYFVGIKLIFQFHYRDVGFIFVYAIVLFAISLGVGLVCVGKKSIYSQLLSERVSEEKCDNKIIRNIGIAFLFFSIVAMFAFYHKSSNIALFCMVFCFLGMVMLLGNCRQYINRLRKSFLFWASDWSYYYKRNYKIVCAASVLYFSMMFLLMMGMVTFPNFEKNAHSYHPYDIAYSLSDKTQWIPDASYIKKIANNENVSLTNMEQISFFNVGSFSVFDVEKVNKVLDRNYSCMDDEAIYINCIVENDGYEHDSTKMINTVHLGDRKLVVNQLNNDVLFGNGCGTSDIIMMISHSNYEKMKKNYTLYTLYAYNFNDYKKIKDVYNQLVSDVCNKNHWSKQQMPYVSCKVLAIENADRSSKFLILLLVYDSILILFSVYIIIRFKLGIEFDNEKHKINLLKSIGCDEKMIKGIINSKIYSAFLFPYVVASFLLVVFSYGTNFTYGYGLIGVLYSGMVIIFLMIIVLTIAWSISKNYYKLISKKS